MFKYLVTYTIIVDSEEELTENEAIERAEKIMESTYIEPSFDDISEEK